MERKTLTKSLHTVTATVNVAAHLAMIDSMCAGLPAADLVYRALSVLGYVANLPAGADRPMDNMTDPTFAMCVKQLRKMGLAS